MADPKSAIRNPPSDIPWSRKDLLGIRELSVAELVHILDTAAAFKEVGQRTIKKVPALRGLTLVNFFVESSTRTRTSFELAAKRLSLDVVNVTAAASSLVKGETLKDTAHIFQANGADIIVMRHSSAGAAHFLSTRLASSIINAGDGAHEHPTQALLDTFTIREKLGRVAGLNVVILGDILFSRVARSNIHALVKLGADVRVVGPPTMMPCGVDKLGARVYYNFDEALCGVQVIMMLRLQLERQGIALFPTIREYARLYGLTAERVKLADSGAIVMHPGPINRGVEIAPEVADSLSSVILDQVANGVAVRMGILYLLSGAN